MSQFRTEIFTQAHPKKIEPNTKVMFLGSCFATNVGNRFSASRIPSLVNPYGVIYNPVSVNNTLEYIINDYTFGDDDLRFKNEHWHTFSHHSSFNHKNKSSYLEGINRKNNEAHHFLKEANYLFITFGTAWVYQYIENNQIVSNCHKYPNKEFNHYLLNISEIIDLYKTIITKLLVFNPTLNIVFTVSPVRHWKDGANANQLSKSTLLLAIDQLVDIFESCSYFPAYEIVLDDLRDYRFYKADMLHPNEVAINYIWQKFEQHFFSNKTLEYQKEITKLVKSVSHRAYDVSSIQHQSFLKNLLIKLKLFKEKYPDSDLSDEISKVTSEIM